MHKRSVLPLLVCLLVACSKEKSNKWLVIDFSAKSSLNGSPVDGRLELEYIDAGYFSSQKQVVEIGETSGGKMYIEYPVEKRMGGFSLRFYAYGGYKIPDATLYCKVDGFLTGQKNIKEVVLDPVYYYALHYKNTNCQNEQDSMWIWEPYQSQAYTGCVDFVQDYSYGCAWSFEPELNYQVKVKRNGQVSYLDKSFTLVHGGVINELLMDY